MVDGRQGLDYMDRTVAREICKADRPVIVLANKCEGTKLPQGYHEALGLGFDPWTPFPRHGDNLGEVYEAIKPLCSANAIIPEEIDEEDLPDSEKPLHIAIVGRPNAGKSTLVNCLVGEERMLTGPEPGLTRDAIHVKWEYKDKPIRLVDTAGMRRRSRVDERIERMSVQESLRAIRLAHVVILVIDASMPFDKQDYIIAQHVIEELWPRTGRRDQQMGYDQGTRRNAALYPSQAGSVHGAGRWRAAGDHVGACVVTV